MFDLEGAVAAWRAGFERRRVFTRDDLEELEDHLRAAYELELHLKPDLAPERAFAQARATLGEARELSGEFEKVRAWRGLLTAAWVVFVVAFFLPVHRDGITLGALDWSEGLLPGIQALLIALGEGPFEVASALTNLAMAATFRRIGEAGRARVGTLAVVLLSSVALNLGWLLLIEPWTDLMAGYWAWTASFGGAGAALALRARTMPSREPADLVLAP